MISSREDYLNRIEEILIRFWNPFGLNQDSYRGQYQPHAEVLYSMVCRQEPMELIDQYLIEVEDKNNHLTPTSLKRLKTLRKKLRREFPKNIPLIQNKTRFYSVIILVIGGLWTLYWGAAFWNVTTKYAEDLNQLSFNEYGDFIAGMASAITLVWVVLGFFMQSLTTRGNTQAVKAQLKEFKELAEQIELQTKA